MKKLGAILLVIIFLLSQVLPAYAVMSIPEYLCEVGIKFYNEGRYEEALKEFKKALLISPNYEPALRYIRKIEDVQPLEMQEEYIYERDFAIKQALTSLETQNQPAEPYEEITSAVSGAAMIIPVQPLSNKLSSLEIEQGKGLVLSAASIQRYLVTEPDILKVERKSQEEILLIGNNIGYTYLHIWTDTGRSSLEVLTVPAKSQGEFLEDTMRLQQEKVRNFKLGYTLDWSDYNTGRGLGTIKRSSYYYIHNLTLIGETPYGNLDSGFTVNRFNTNTNLTHYTVGLTKGKFRDFKNFNIRGFDFFDFPPDFSNLSFPGTPLRGVLFASPAFNNKLNYTAFYGKENWSGYASLSPNLLEEKKAYLEGFNFGFKPTKGQDYHFTLIHGWGKDRDPALKSYGYDFIGNLFLDKLKLGIEAANDTKKFANLFNLHYIQPNLSFDAQLRDINKNFQSITGSGWNQGQIGSLFTFNYRPIEKLEIYSTLDLYKDRLYPAQGDDKSLNQDFNWNTTYRFDALTSLALDYNLQNELGRVSQYRYQSIDAGLNRTFKFFKDINLFLKYYHQENTNFSSPVSSYGNERVYGGLKLNLTRDLYYYANGEINWLRENFSGNRSTPRAFETGLDWSGQIASSPFWGVCRFTFRDEEDTLSNLSFLSGEDYIEGYSELSFRPNPDTQIYGSCRIRNVWADNPNVNKRVEANFNGGLRFLWDTGINWQVVGDIEGYVFKDYNGDGVMQRDEPPVQGIKVWLGKNKSAVADIFGYFRFNKVKGNQVYVNLDTATMPNGFILTVPASQVAMIIQHQVTRVDFGINARSEIFGYIFEDANGDNQFGKEDKGIRNAVVMLENGMKKITDSSGKYSFSNVKPGEHEVTLDLGSIPVYYLPKTTLTKKITLFEGVAYNYNIPLKRTEE